TLTVTLDELLLFFHTDKIVFGYTPKYNIAPGQMIAAAIADGNETRIGQLKWGLIPPWASNEKTGYKMINARAETLDKKAAFSDAIKRKRCLIPADGFYEWNHSGEKYPVRIVMSDRGLFAMAGIYETWTAPDGRKVHSCAIITTRPNELVSKLHDRMPVIVRREHWPLWLDRNMRDIRLLTPLFAPYPAEEMEYYRVSPAVGNVKNDSAACIEPIA
ncbi:MAG TPA: SOS response-associated peptidase, partial [Bacilli bacterium]